MEEVRAFQNDNAQRMAEIGKRLGTDVKFFEGDPNINGHYKDGSIHINVNSERSLEYVFGHELYHYLRDQTHDQDLDKLTNFLLGEAKDLLMPQGDLNTLVQAKIEQYGAYGEELTGYQAKEELLADAVGKLLENEGAIERLIRYDQGMFQKVRYWVEDMIARFRGTPEERRFLQAQRLLERAVEKSSGILSGESKTGAYSYVGTDSDGIRYYESDLKSASKQDRIDEFSDYFKDNFNNSNVIIDGADGSVRVTMNRKGINKNLSTGKINKRMRHQRDLIDILQNAKLVDIKPEESYFDPDIPPKNDAHRGTKYWHHYKSIVDLEGDKYEVEFSVAEKRNGEYKFYYAGIKKANILTGAPNGYQRRILAPKDSIDEKKFTVNPVVENNSSKYFGMADSFDIDGNSVPLHMRRDDELYSLGGELAMPGGDVAYRGQMKTRSLYESAAESDLVHS
ncbi:MAG: hypothetical protein Q4A75_06050, partial [Peptostreptococcaceae bacterium]|nr:hypothetical protein [Peptostreptococcaceae bacterium]